MTFGGIELGARPCVNGTVSTREGVDALCAEVGADAIELRLDLIPEGLNRASSLCDQAAQTGRPVLATCRLQAEGGAYVTDDARRAALLVELLDHADAIDVEWSSAHARSVCAAASKAGKPAVVSVHDFEATPSAAVLRDMIAAVREFDTAVPKVAAMAQTPRDVERLRQLLIELKTAGPICVIAMGDHAGDTRLSFSLEGSCFTYAYLDAAVAPGQWVSHELVAALSERSPAYAAARV